MRENLEEPNMTTILEDRELGCPPVAVIDVTGIESTEDLMSTQTSTNRPFVTNPSERLRPTPGTPEISGVVKNDPRSG